MRQDWQAPDGRLHGAAEHDQSDRAFHVRARGTACPRHPS